MILALLLGCYDKLEIVARIDRDADTVTGRSRLVNMWKRSIPCLDTPSCLSALEQEVDNQERAILEKGATAVKGGLVLRNGEVDLVMSWTFPLAAMKLDHQQFMLLQERPLRKGASQPQSKPRLAFVYNGDDMAVSFEKLPFGAREIVFPDVSSRHVVLLPGKRVDFATTFTTLDDVGAVAHEAGWVSNFFGLEAALASSPQLWVEPSSAP